MDAAAARSVCVRVDGADHTPDVAARVEALARASRVPLEEQTPEGEAPTTTTRWIAHAGAIAPHGSAGATHPRAAQLALAALFHWALADVATLNVEIYDPAFGVWISFEAASLLSETREVSPVSVHVLSADEETTIDALLNEANQVIDARSLLQYLGLDPLQQVVGHFEHAVCVPYHAVFDENEGAFLSSEMILAELEVARVDFEKGALVIGATAIEAAAVATALILAGHPNVQLSLIELSDDFVKRLPRDVKTNVFEKNDLYFAKDEGYYDLSPNALAPSKESAGANEVENELGEEYKKRLKKSDTKQSSSNANDHVDDEVVWMSADGQHFFDMPHPLSKTDFIEASREIYRLVSFVLAPFGFPFALQERFSVSEIKTRCSALYQDVIEVCSDLVYHHRGLDEGAMAMSVHKWVETVRDPECSQQVRSINDLLDVLYEPPTFVEVPDMDEEVVASVAIELERHLSELIQKRAPWALVIEEEEEELLAPLVGHEDLRVSNDPTSNGWKDSVYPSVVYTLGFLPPELHKHHQRLSTLQIKTFIQAAAEAIWDVISEHPCSQIEYQALCDAISGEDKLALLRSVKGRAERGLYVVRHSLMQSLEREADVVETVATVRDMVEDGNRAYRSGRYDVALSYFATALSQLPVFHPEVAPVLVGRIKCHVQLGHLDQATSEANILLKIDPFSVGAYTCLGEIDEKLSRSDQAMQHYVTAFILDGSRSPDHASAIDRVARNVGRSVAKDIFKEMVLHHELPSQWLVESYFDSFEHDVDYAARVPFDIEKALGLGTTELDAQKLLSRAIFQKRKKQYKQAQVDIQAALEKGLEDDTLHAMALNLHASFLYVAGDVHAAIGAIGKSLELTPSSVNGLVKKGGFLSEVGEMEEATKCFNEAAEIDPNDADIYLHMGQKDLLEGNYYEAVQCLRRSISRSEALPVTHVSYGMALYKSGSTYQAVDVFEEAVKKFPESPEVHLFFGEVLADQGNYAAAMRHFLRALELSPQCPLPFLNAGRVYVSTNDPLRAIAHFQQALVIDPRCSSAHLDIAQVLFAQGRTAEAFHHFDCAARCCRFLPEVEEACAAREMARMQERVTDILGVDLRHIMRSK